MHSQSPSLSSLFRTISLAIIAALLMAVAMVPAWAQNSVPPTAVQAAKMPQFASKLAHPVKRPGPPISPALARARMHRGPLQDNDIYDNGPINGNTDAWTINFGFVVSDTFTVPSGGDTITGGTFGLWLFSGDTLSTAELSITAGENGGTSYFDQTVNFTMGTCTVNQYGYNICSVTTSFTGPPLNGGTYWVNLQNASVPSGDPVYWDENSGVGCTGTGCPSSASDSEVGTIPSESFTILGSSTTTTTTSSTVLQVCPDRQPGLDDLYNFPSDSGASGVAIGAAGKLYGTFAKGGKYGAGMLFGLADKASRWFLSSLYSFLGGSNGGSPNGVIVGPQGALYGSAGGGYGYGLIYKATPPPTACATALCSWNETTIYQFAGNGDAEGGTVTAFDSAGNLYGIGGGGAYGQGAVFELSPSDGGWTEKVIYSFTGGTDGGGPNSLLLGHDGNLYGAAGYGGNNDCNNGFAQCGVVFQLVPSGSGWTENVIYAFTGSNEDGWSPGGLIQTAGGDLIGFSLCNTIGGGQGCVGGGQYAGLIFGLAQYGNTGWQFNQVSQYRGDACYDHGSDFVTYGQLALDGAGNLYAVDGGGWYYKCGAVVNISSETQLVGGYDDIFFNLVADAEGNLYGTTSTCGFGTPQRNNGMVWEYFATKQLPEASSQ
ncbi:MAG: hypothetical protein ACLPPV_08085 [Candidatus Korobacteraceae bacterium]|jgi:hypothetical protein